MPYRTRYQSVAWKGGLGHQAHRERVSVRVEPRTKAQTQDHTSEEQKAVASSLSATSVKPKRGVLTPIEHRGS